MMSTLPFDVYHPIFSYLSNPDLCSCRLLSRQHSNIAERYFRPSGQDLCRAIDKGDLVDVRYLLSLGVDPSARDSEALRRASRRGYTEIVRMLLEDGRVDPSARDSEALRWASGVGRIEIIRMLLEDGRVDLSARYSEALRQAALDAHIEIFRMLLEYGRVIPSAQISQALRYASTIGHVEVVQLLEQHLSR